MKRHNVARKQAELTQRLLVEAGQALEASNDPNAQLVNIAQVLVPLLADWCVVHLTEAGMSIHPVAVAHADPQKVALVDALQQHYMVDPAAPLGVAQVLQTGQPKFYPKIPADFHVALAQNPEQLELTQSLGISSVMIVPLVTRGQTLGTITLAVSAESGRFYTDIDLILAEELARRAALAVDNARLYEKSKQLNSELEEQVLKRTVQLQAANIQLKKSRAQVLRLAFHEQTAREEERTRLARELHDELGQNLTGLKMDLAWLQKHTGSKQAKLLQKFNDISTLIDTTIRSVRRIATQLRPGMLDDLGLLAAVEWQLQEFEKRTGIQCKFSSNLEAVTLDRDGVTALFRILQETLTNVARHAAATEVEVTLEQSEMTVTLQIRDNGRGITANEAAGLDSLGLLGMRERVAWRGGKFDIYGSPRHGTVVLIGLPCQQEAR